MNIVDLCKTMYDLGYDSGYAQKPLADMTPDADLQNAYRMGHEDGDFDFRYHRSDEFSQELDRRYPS